MILSTVNGQSVYVLTETPNGDTVALKASLVASRSASLTNLEERRPLCESLRLLLTYRVQVEAASARTLIAQLRTITTEPVAAPVWPEARLWADRATASVTAGLYLLYRPGTSIATVYAATDSAPGWQTDTDIVVPLLVGYLESREVKWVSSTVCEFDVKLAESSPVAWAITGSAYTALTGPNPSGLPAAPEVFPFPTDWSTPKQDHVVRIDRETIGFTREAVATYRPSVRIARKITQRAWVDAEDGWTTGKLLAWFSAHGAGRAFWIAESASISRLVSNVEANATGLNLEDTTGIAVGDYLAAVSGSVVVATFGPVTAVTARVAAFVGMGTPALDADDIRIVSLALCRVDKSEIKVAFANSVVASADFQVSEVPPETTVPPAGEVAGQTFGKLATRAWLYTFERSVGDTGILGDIVSEDANYITFTRNEDVIREDAQTITSSLGTAGGLIGEDDISITFVSADSETGIIDTFTSFERDLEDDGRIYFSRPITHGARTQGIALEQDSISITCDGLNIPPILESALLLSEVPCKVTIERCEVVDGEITNRETIFTGDLAKCKVDGKRVAATAISAGSFFDLKAPRFYNQAGCNHSIYSPGCRLLAANWKHTGTITDPGEAGYPYQFEVGGLSRPAGGDVITAADAFAGGWVEIGTGAAVKRRAILSSTAANTGGKITLTLHSDPSPYPVAGTAIAIFPGCDGAATTCKRFGNYANFGGSPKIPVGNPSLFKLSSNVGGGGKKG